MDKPGPSSQTLIRLTIEHTRLFAGWPADAVEQLVRVAEVREYQDGETVARIGDPPSGMLLIAEGSVESSRSKPSGDRIVFDYLQPGQFTGIFPTFDGQPVPLDLTARGPARVVFIPREPFVALVKSRGDLAVAIVELLCRRERLSYERLMMAALDSLRVRVAKMLLYFSRGPESAVSNVKVPGRISQDNIAAMLGISRQSVNKEMAAFIRAGIVARRYSGIEVLDLKQLVAVASEEHSLSGDAQTALFARSRRHHRASD